MPNYAVMPRLSALIFVACALAFSVSTTDAAPPGRPPVLISDVAHSIEGRTLTVTGLVRNVGRQPLARLVVDALGFAPSGELSTGGSDGVPWVLEPGQSERFSIAMLIPKRLVREYVVQVAESTPPFTPITTLRKGIDVELYRPLILSLIGLRAQVQGSQLSIQVDTEDLPVTLITAQLTLLLTNGLTDHFEAVAFRLDVPANTTKTVFLGSTHALLLAARVADFRLRSSWEN